MDKTDFYSFGTAEPEEFSDWVKTFLLGSLEYMDDKFDKDEQPRDFMETTKGVMKVGLEAVKNNNVADYYIAVYNALDDLIYAYHAERVDEFNEEYPHIGDFMEDITFETIIKELHKMLVSKNIDYGNSFDKGIERFGLTGAVIRLYDKLNRLVNLDGDDGEVVGEASLDTMRDVIGYLMLTLHYYQDKDKVGEDIA